MGRIKIVHTADLHLGSACLGVPPHIGKHRRKDMMQTLTRISEVCREQLTDLLLITGDLWDERNITRPLVDFIADQFRRIPSTRVIITPGRADGTGLNSFYREYPWSENVHIFLQPQLTSFWIPHLNTRIFGRAWSPEDAALDWQQVLDSQGCQVVIAAYGNPDSLAIPQGVLALENLAYVALGGAHKHTAWTGKVMDPGCPEPLGFDNQGSFGIIQGSVGTESGSLEFVPFNSRQFFQLQLNTETCSSSEEVAGLIQREIEALTPSQNLFQIHLEGQGRWDLSEVRNLLPPCFYIDLLAKEATPYNLDALETEQQRGVVGKYIAAIKESQCDAEIARRALNLGLDALLSGRVVSW